MFERTLSIAVALTLGAAAAYAESVISPDGLKASGASVTVGSATAEKDGYVVVHRTDFTGTLPGAMIGHAPVKAGQNADISITLDKPAEPGTNLIVMLHEEGNNDTVLDDADKPAKAGGKVVQQIVTVREMSSRGRCSEQMALQAARDGPWVTGGSDRRFALIR